AKRGFFVDGGGRDWSFRRPGPPFRLSKTPTAPTRPAPSVGDSSGSGHPPRRLAADPVADPSLPFAGLKVLDLTTFWAGGYLTCYLGAFGADVVKLESIQRPDGFRYSGAQPFEGDDWYERSPLWQATNLNKRDITLDLSSPAGRDLARRLAAQADVVVENFSPRVVEQFGLDYESLAALRPDEGQRIEVAQIEVGAAVTAEPVIEYSMNGIVAPREGNRRRGCRQGVYPTDSDDTWVALSVRDDTDWSRLARAIDRPHLPADDADAFDHAVAAWTRRHSAANVVAALREHDIPAE